MVCFPSLDPGRIQLQKGDSHLLQRGDYEGIPISGLTCEPKHPLGLPTQGERVT